jgi:hypothetical protein
MKSVVTLTCFLVLFASTATATTFVVPEDDELISKSAAVAIGTVEGSYVQETDGIIETVYEIRVERSLKALPRGQKDQLLRVVSPGGILGDRGMHVEAAAHFEQGQRVLLFLTLQKGRWTTTDLTLGKFRFVTSTAGDELLVRDMEDVVGWDRRGEVHHEQVRRRDGFLEFIEERINGRVAKRDYVVDASQVTLAPEEPPTQHRAEVNAAPFPGATYTSWVSNNPTRWPNIAAGVTFRKRADQNIAGLADGGVSVIQNGLAGWTNECGSVINLIYGGTTPTVSKGFDSQNVVEFNDPQGRIAGSWTGSGTIGICFNSFSNTHTFDGRTWWSISDADVVIQDGFPGTHSAFPTAMTHELGHGIGWRHSNQNHITKGACDPTVEQCTSAAIMNSSVSAAYGYTLQPWDINAAQSVYPGGTCGVVCTSPSISAQPQSASITSGTSRTLTVTASGTAPLSYQWYVGTSGNTASPVSGATSSSLTVAPTATTAYWVRVSNACGSVNSAAATLTVSAPPPPPPPPPPTTRTLLRSDFNGDGKSEIFWRNTTTGENMVWFVTGAVLNSSVTLPSMGTQWTVATMADFNGDGRSDIFWRDSGGNHQLWLMNGSAVTPVAVASAATSWNFVSSGDFDGDGTFDLFWRNTSTGANLIWFMASGAVRSTATLPTAGSSAVPAGIGDFNGDGKWDIFWRNLTTGTNYMWFMNGATPRGQAYLGNALNWTAVASADISGDRIHDIIWRDTRTGANKFWRMSGTGATEVSLPSTSTLTVVGVPGDFNGDRTDDLAWRNTGNGNVALWLFTSGVPRSGSLPAVALAWQMFGTK